MSSEFNLFAHFYTFTNFFRNNKRVAEIWLDEYKKYLYERHPERYQNLDIGDISQQVALKKNLGCRSFSYFLDIVAPDMLERFPLEDFKPFASGTVRFRKSFRVLI